MNEIIQVRNLSKKYGKCLALKNVSFSLKPGEILALLGHNGAGKTTLINAIMALTSYEGEIQYSFDRKDLYSNVSIQLQNTIFEDTAKVKEVCNLYKKLLQCNTDIDLLLSRFQLTDKANSYVKNLSGGEKQKLSILLTLINNPKVVIFDELTAGLDVVARRNIWTILKQLQKDTELTIILTSHFLDEVEFLADRAIILDHGVKKVEGSIREIIEQCFGDRKKIRFNIENIDEAREALPFSFRTDGVDKCITEYSSLDEEKILKGVRDCKAENIEISRFTFEDAFLKILGYKLTEEGAMNNV